MYANIKETHVRAIHQDFYCMENDNKRSDRGCETAKSACCTFVVAISARGPLEAGSFTRMELCRVEEDSHERSRRKRMSEKKEKKSERIKHSGYREVLVNNA